LVSEGGIGGGRKNSTSISRNEAELMDKIESLQHEINARHREFKCCFINMEFLNEFIHTKSLK